MSSFYDIDITKYIFLPRESIAELLSTRIFFGNMQFLTMQIRRKIVVETSLGKDIFQNFCNIGEIIEFLFTYLNIN